MPLLWLFFTVRAFFSMRDCSQISLRVAVQMDNPNPNRNPTQMGLASEGVEDLASGLLSGAFYMGGALGPLLGGAATSLFGFQWTGALMSALLLLMCLILRLTAGTPGSCCGRRRGPNPNAGPLEEVRLLSGTEE
jgi:predicted MFS family arabinose efflux permease